MGSNAMLPREHKLLPVGDAVGVICQMIAEVRKTGEQLKRYIHEENTPTGVWVVVNAESDAVAIVAAYLVATEGCEVDPIVEPNSVRKPELKLLNGYVANAMRKSLAHLK